MAPPTKVKKGKTDVAKGKVKADAVKSKVRSAAVRASTRHHASILFQWSTLDIACVHTVVCMPFRCDGSVAAAHAGRENHVQAHTVMARHCTIVCLTVCLVMLMRAVLSRVAGFHLGPAALELLETEPLWLIYRILLVPSQFSDLSVCRRSRRQK